jgi:hypothetical protein
MRRTGRKSEQAAIRHPHATDERDRVLTEALGDLVKNPSYQSRRGQTADRNTRAATPSTAKGGLNQQQR